MNRAIFLILCTVLPTVAIAEIKFENKSCKEERLTDKEHKILSSEYITKPDENSKPKQYLNTKKKASLYCPKTPNSNKCDSDVWFTLKQYVQYKSSYKNVTCIYQFTNSSYINGVKTYEAGIVYFTKP